MPAGLGIISGLAVSTNFAAQALPSIQYQSRSQPPQTFTKSIQLSDSKVHAQQNQPKAFPCETYIAFIDPVSGTKDECSPWFDRSNQTKWTPSAKQKIDRAITEIAKKAPGLLARACNGEKVALRLFHGDGASAETDPCQIAIFTNLFHAPTRFMAETIAHEMTHLIDYGANLSDSKEWNGLITPLLTTYRKEFPNPDKLDVSRVMHKANRRMKQLGIPDDYAAENPSEALAEYAAVISCSGFAAPARVKAFIAKNILSKPDAPSEKASLIRSACRAMNRQDDDRAIGDFTKLLRLDPSYVFAYWFMGIAWWEKDEPEIASFNLRRSRSLMLQNNVPAYSDDLERVSSLVEELDEQLAETAKLQNAVAVNKATGVVALHAKKKR